MLNAIILGILLGIVSGLTPGIHTNTLSAFILSYSAILSKYFSVEDLAVVVFVNAIVHTFLDILPSMFLGVPDEDTAIAVLPTHELVLDGKGIVATSISAYSSLLSFLISLPIFLIFLLVLPNMEFGLSAITPFLLFAVSIAMILGEKGEMFEGSLSAWRKRAFASLIFLLSGLLGFYSFGRDDTILLPLLTGLFSSPTLLISAFSESNVPMQEVSLEMPNLRDVLSGSLAGALVSLFPGISSGIATVMASNHLRDKKRIVSAISSANTANALLCFAVLFSIHRVRSGAVDAFMKLGGNVDLATFLLIGLISALTGAILTIAFGLLAGGIVPKIDQLKLSVLVFAMLIFFTYVTTGAFGLFVFSLATIVGLLAVIFKVRRINCMGCLILPTILLYLRF